MSDWKLARVENVTAMHLYEWAQQHKLVPDDPNEAVARYHHLEKTATVLRLSEDDKEIAIFILCDISQDRSATIEMIPHPQYFRGGYDEKFIKAMAPFWDGAFEKFNLRRITAFVPDSRGRTKKALKVCGFVHEGKIRQMAKFKGKAPEDVFVLGLLRGEQAVIKTGDSKDMDGDE